MTKFFSLGVSLALATVACCNCSSGASGGTSSTSGTTGGGTGTGDAGAYTVVPVDPRTGEGVEGAAFAMAVGPSNQIGIAAFVGTDGGVDGQTAYQVTYYEVQNGQVTVPAQVIRTVENVDGLTVNFMPDGTPAVGFVGGGQAPDAGASSSSVYWLQSQAEIAYRQPDGGWNQQICMTDSTDDGGFTWTVPGAGGDDMESMQLINEGNVVGLWPSLIFDGGTAVMAFRDVHFGQDPIQDWGASDVKLCAGGPAPLNWGYSAPMTIQSNGNHKSDGFGVHNQMVIGKGGLLAIVSDNDVNDQGEFAGGGSGVSFVLQAPGTPTMSTADWSYPYDPFDPTGDPSSEIDATGTGPTLVYADALGYSIAVTDSSLATPTLYYVNSPDGVNWGTVETVYGTTSGGFYPSMAVDPFSGAPNITFVVCSDQVGVQPAPGACTSGAGLELAIRNDEGWGNQTTIFKGAFFAPKLAFLSTGKRAIVYRDLDTGALSVAIEN